MNKDRRKKQIMAKALELFARQGYHSTSVTDVIREVGVVRGTFYRYFKDKQDLFDQLLDVNINFLSRVLPSIPFEDKLSLEELEAILTIAFKTLMSQPNSRDFVTLMLTEAAGADKIFYNKVESFYDKISEILSKYISRMQKEGRVRQVNADAAAYMVLGLLKEIFKQWVRQSKFKEGEQLVHEVANFLVNSLKAQ